MKKRFGILASAFIMISCSNSSSDSSTSTVDSSTLPDPAFNDTLAQPGGMANSNVISTDTAAINVKNSMEKVDSQSRKK